MKYISETDFVTIFIEAPRQLGKSSLMRRVIHWAAKEHHRKSAFIDFQKFPKQYFEDEKAFLIEFCRMLGDDLKVSEAIDQYWRGQRTNIYHCSQYLSNYIIPQLNEPFILAMDEVERMLTSPFRSNFFGMLRTWHNDKIYNDSFAKMTMLLSSSTEPSVFIDPNQSPFNVAEVIPLQDFTEVEVNELNARYYYPLNSNQVRQLMTLLDGHPFLTRQALHLLASGKIKFEKLVAQATEDTGPFASHLRHYYHKVLAEPTLKQALIEICHHQTCRDDQAFYHLKGLGLVKKNDRVITLRNELYTLYFKDRLNG